MLGFAVSYKSVAPANKANSRVEPHLAVSNILAGSNHSQATAMAGQNSQ